MRGMKGVPYLGLGLGGIPSRFAKTRIACSSTADWLIPSCLDNCSIKICASSLKRILVFFLRMLTLYHNVWYTINSTFDNSIMFAGSKLKRSLG